MRVPAGTYTAGEKVSVRVVNDPVTSVCNTVDEATVAFVAGVPLLSATIANTTSPVGVPVFDIDMSALVMSLPTDGLNDCAVRSTSFLPHWIVPIPVALPSFAAAFVDGSTTTGSFAFIACPAVIENPVLTVVHDSAPAPSVESSWLAVPSADGGVYVTPRSVTVPVAVRFAAITEPPGIVNCVVDAPCCGEVEPIEKRRLKMSKSIPDVLVASRPATECGILDDPVCAMDPTEIAAVAETSAPTIVLSSIMSLVISPVRIGSCGALTKIACVVCACKTTSAIAAAIAMKKFS